MFFNLGGDGFPRGFPGAGGGGGGRRRPARPEADTDTEALYKELNIEKDATPAQVKKAYRRAAMKHHPDKGGDPEKFKAISEAYEILGDADKRKLYDEGGKDAVENGGAGGPEMADIFDLFGGGGRRRRNQKRKGEDVAFPLKVTLNDLYKSVTKKLRLTRNVICSDCNGKGGTNSSTCRDCRGQGIRVVLRQVGPGMVQQMRAKCPACGGTGQMFAAKDKCTTCRAKKTVKQKKTLEVYVRKGSKHGERIVFQGEADEAPNTVPGDVVVILQQVEHPLFKREGKHLFYKKTITLVESLTGFDFLLEHLDGRQLRVQSEPGKVYCPGDFVVIRDEGMPAKHNPNVTGNLYVEFTVEFPTASALDSKAREGLKKLLPAAKPVVIPSGAETEDVELVDVNMEEERKKFKARAEREAYDDEDDDPRRRHGGPACQTQ